MSSSKEKLLLTRQSPLLDVPETMELTSPSPTASPQESPNLETKRRKFEQQRLPRQSIDGVQVYRDLLQSNSCLRQANPPSHSISVISDQLDTEDVSSTAKGGKNGNAKKNGLAKSAWRNKRDKGSLGRADSNEQTLKEKRLGSCAGKPGMETLISSKSSPSLSTTTTSKCGNNSGGLKMKLRAIGKFSTLESACKNNNLQADVNDPLNKGEVCLMEHKSNRIFKVRCHIFNNALGSILCDETVITRQCYEEKWVKVAM
ncbi:hypothetical protein RRG08_021824 [Elysia crispata]|uniref:Uncharacterized protein n=1 Tax=Elysia crispata TaxID=231223 RepID=A0AAE0ZXY1_9GAST|nr:hypothetical protein RRG08_021824 [Elysia crispata]